MVPQGRRPRERRRELNIATMYDSGDGVLQDRGQAAAWYRKAADQGNALRTVNLGLMYDAGVGVPQDYAQAVVWYRKAADQGNAEAQLGLGRMYDTGHGVPQAYVQAHMWFNLSASRAKDPNVGQTALKCRDNVAARMTPVQIAEAQRMASDWKPAVNTAEQRIEKYSSEKMEKMSVDPGRSLE